MKNNMMEQFHKTLVAACSAVGVPEEAIVMHGAAIVIPSENITITPGLSGVNRVRVWQITTTFTVSSIDGVSEHEVRNLIFEEPLSAFWTVSKRVALYLAEKYIENAIEQDH